MAQNLRQRMEQQEQESPTPSPTLGQGSAAQSWADFANANEEEWDDTDVIHSFQVGVINFGCARKTGEAMYADNLFKMPVAVGLCMEMDETHVDELVKPKLEWHKNDHPLAVQEPPQGYLEESVNCEGGDDSKKYVHRWMCTDVYRGLAVCGRMGRVKDLKVLRTDEIAYKDGLTKLMLVEVEWHKPIDSRDSITVGVGHLHNALAKTKDTPELKKWYQLLEQYCAGGMRLFGTDANMALFNIIPEMKRRGCGFTLLANHMELKAPARVDATDLLHDSMGLFAVGWLEIERSQKQHPYNHIFWGAVHPKAIDKVRDLHVV